MEFEIKLPADQRPEGHVPVFFIDDVIGDAFEWANGFYGFELHSGITAEYRGRILDLITNRRPKIEVASGDLIHGRGPYKSIESAEKVFLITLDN